MNNRNQHRAIKISERSICGLSLLLFGFLIVWGQTSSLAFNENIQFDPSEYPVFSQDTEGGYHHQGHLAFEADEQEASKENFDNENSAKNSIFPPPLSSFITSKLSRLENSGVKHQFPCLFL